MSECKRYLKIDLTNYIVLIYVLSFCGIQCSTELANLFQLSPLNRKRSSSEELDGDRRQWRPRHPLRLCRFHRTNLSHSNVLTLCFTPLRTTTTTNPFSLSIRIWGARSKASRAIAAGQSSVSPTWAKTPPLSPTPTLLLHWFLSPLSPLLPNSPPKMPKRLSFSSPPRPRPSPRKSPPSPTPSSFAPSLGGSSLFAHVAFLAMHDASFAPLCVFFGFDFDQCSDLCLFFRLLWVSHFGELLYCAGIEVMMMQFRNLEVPITVILSRLCIPSTSSAPFS